MAYSLDVQETSIDMTTQFLKIRQIGDMLLHSKVIRIIDGGLSPKSSAFLKVLLDVRLLELNVNAGVYPVGDDTGSELGGCSFGNLPLEEELPPVPDETVLPVPDVVTGALTAPVSVLPPVAGAAVLYGPPSAVPQLDVAQFALAEPQNLLFATRRCSSWYL